MQYQFDKIIDRSENHSAKYDERRKKFGTDKVIPLWIADMDFKTAQPIIDALEHKAQQGIYGYTTRPDSYFEAICGWQLRRNGWKIDPALMSFSTGVVPALSAIVRQFSDEGDKVLIQTPVYPEFYEVVEAWDRTIIESPLEEHDGAYSINFTDFEEQLKQHPRLFILCSPHNPIGTVWSREELTRMCELCIRYGVRIISDEIHSDLILWGNKHIPTASLSPEIAAHTISCISGTKTFNLAGLQASANVFPNAADKAIFDRFWTNLDILRNNCFSLVAMEAAFRHGDEWLDQLIPYLEGNIRFVHDFCAAQITRVKPAVPQSTYLIWLDCRGLRLDNDALHTFMIEQAGLGLNDGVAFARGLSGFMRLNAACPRSVLEQAMKQLKAAVDSLA